MLVLGLPQLLLVCVIAWANELRDPATDQVVYFKKRTEGPVGVLTTSGGAPVSYAEASSSLNTPLVNNDFFMDLITNINRERIPERILHSRGAGAFGFFEVTHDISHICNAAFLNIVGKKTTVAVRYSTALSERGTPELSRDLRGFAIKFYTEEGNFDLIGNNIPMYFYKDPLRFHTILHGLKRNPATNLMDPNTMWDVLTQVPEAIHLFLRVFSDIGIPASYRSMPSYGIHSYQVENRQGDYHFMRFHTLPDGGVKTLTTEEAGQINDPDYLTRDLFGSIGNGDFPSWTVYVQILDEGDVKRNGSQLFDTTRVLPVKEFPLHPIGKLVLNRNAKNAFAEIEQLAFCVCNIVPGINGAPDKIFESRRLGYRDAQLYRLGKNYNRIAVNCPFQTRTFTYNRDGVPPVGDNERDTPNYYPNSFHGPVPYMTEGRQRLIKIIEDKAYNFDQAAEYYVNELSDDERIRMLGNLVSSLQPVTKFIKDRAVEYLSLIHPDLGRRVSQALRLAKPVPIVEAEVDV